MKNSVALIGRPDPARAQVATYLRDLGFDVHECDESMPPQRFTDAVVMDDGHRAVRVGAWIDAGTSRRVVVVSPRPASWKAVELAHPDRLTILAAPAFGWQIVDALRAGLHR